jgi:hypothetical protein
MIVVSDTSCIGYLLMIDNLRLLKDNFNQIIIPEAVRLELLNLSSKYNVKRFLDERWVEVMSIHQSILFDQLSKQLDERESEAIVLCKDLNADLLLIDERKGTSIARSLGINTIGILGVLLLSKRKGIISSVHPVLNKLISETTFRISKELHKKFLQQANEQ